MDYFSLINLSREPFSTTPDPGFFFTSKQHLGGLRRLELAIRLKRGMTLVTGKVGTGKSTLCRKLLHTLDQDPKMSVHLILDPYFTSPDEFLRSLAAMLTPDTNTEEKSDRFLREELKNTLYELAVNQEKITVLLIDEGQKITQACLEVLRELLNFETNSEKLLQIVLFAQDEITETLQKMANVQDRIHLTIPLGPLSLLETRAMIRHRLELASDAEPPNLFSPAAVLAIYRASKGHPRQIIHLCHKSLLSMIIAGKPRVNRGIVKGCLRRESHPGTTIRALTHPWRAALLLVCCILAGAATPTLISTSTTSQASITTSCMHGPIIKETDQPETHTIFPSPAKVSPLPGRNNSPTALGKIHLKTGDTLWSMARFVYGLSGKFVPERYLQGIVEHNPDLKGLDSTRSGQSIRFPILSRKMLKENVHIVCLYRSDSLEQAYRFLTKNTLPDTALLAYQPPGSPSHFAVVIEHLFPNRLAAQTAASLRKKSLPPTRLFELQKDNTVLFSSWAIKQADNLNEHDSAEPSPTLPTTTTRVSQ